MALSSRQLEWIAGFLEGEGSFTFQKNNRQPRVSANQVQKEPLEILFKHFGGSLTLVRSKRTNCSDIYQWSVQGSAAAGLMMTLFSLMVTGKRRDQIKQSLFHWKQVPLHNRFKKACKNGHEFTPENTYTIHGERRCRTCVQTHQRSWERKRAKEYGRWR